MLELLCGICSAAVVGWRLQLQSWETHTRRIWLLLTGLGIVLTILAVTGVGEGMTLWTAELLREVCGE